MHGGLGVGLVSSSCVRFGKDPEAKGHQALSLNYVASLQNDRILINSSHDC